jgi:hypothetical protein
MDKWVHAYRVIDFDYGFAGTAGTGFDQSWFAGTASTGFDQFWLAGILESNLL